MSEQAFENTDDGAFVDARNPFAVSDGLTRMRRRMEEFADTGFSADAPGTAYLIAEAKALAQAALAMEHLVSQLKWNAQALAERTGALDDFIAQEAHRPGSNVVLFSAPVTGPRPSGGGRVA